MNAGMINLTNTINLRKLGVYLHVPQYLSKTLDDISFKLY